MAESKRRLPPLFLPVLASCLMLGLSGCLCYPYHYGGGYSSRYGREYYQEDDCGDGGHARYESATSSEIREPAYRAPEPPPAPTRRRRRSPEG